MKTKNTLQLPQFKPLMLRGKNLDIERKVILEKDKTEVDFDRRSSLSLNSLFDNRSGVDARLLFLELFDALPLVHYIGNIDIEKARRFLIENYASEIEHNNYTSVFKKRKKKLEKRQDIFVLTEGRIIEFAEEQCDILCLNNHAEFTENLLLQLNKFKKRDGKQRKREINLITTGYEGFHLTEVEVNPVRLNLSENYPDDFKVIDELIQKRLNKKNDKGIVLLHGLPGTGKTTYLRYLVARLKKKVLFLPPDIAANLTQPSFLTLLIENPNSVLVIEDAENIILDRKEGGSASVSNLLNVSDGLLSDVLNMQIVCTFNIHVSKVDSALLRKGRLIAKYEFGKLPVEKAQRLSDKLGYKNVIKEDMSLAEIYNQNEREFIEQKQKIGFLK